MLKFYIPLTFQQLLNSMPWAIQQLLNLGWGGYLLKGVSTSQGNQAPFPGVETRENFMNSGHMRGKVCVPGKAGQQSVDEQIIMVLADDLPCFIVREQA